MYKKNKYITDFLFTTPTFLSGAGTVMNLSGNYYQFNTCESGREADALAIGNDFEMIGQDIYEALESLTPDK